MRLGSKTRIAALGIILALLVSWIWTPTTYAATAGGIDVTGISFTGPPASTSTVITITGQNLPILSGAQAAANGGYDYPGFEWEDKTDQTGWGGAHWPDADGINVLSNTNTQIQFTLATLTAAHISSGAVFKIFFGSPLAAYATYNTGTGAFAQISQAAAPTSLTANAGNQAIGLTWTAGSGDVAYNVYVNGQLRASGLPQTSYNVTGLTNGTQYTFTVSATDYNGVEGPQSSPVTAAPKAPPLTPAPTSVTASGTPGGTGTITWADASAPSGTVYTVYNGGKPIGTTTSLNYAIPSYDPSGVYGVSAAAAGYSPSAEVTVTLPTAFKPGMTGSDILTNAAALIKMLAPYIVFAGSLLVLTMLLALVFWVLRRRRQNERRGKGKRARAVTVANPTAPVTPRKRPGRQSSVRAKNTTSSVKPRGKKTRGTSNKATGRRSQYDYNSGGLTGEARAATRMQYEARKRNFVASIGSMNRASPAFYRARFDFEVDMNRKGLQAWRGKRDYDLLLDDLRGKKNKNRGARL